MKKLWLLGAGGHARVVADAALASKIEIAGAIDDAQELWGKEFYGATIHGPGSPSQLRALGAGNLLLAIGSNRVREALAGQFWEFGWAEALVHPSAVVSTRSGVSDGSVVFAGAVVQCGTTVGEHTILNTRCSVDHDCRIGDFAHIAPGATLCGGVMVGRGALVGAGATIIPGIKIGAYAMVGAGATVVRDVPDGATVVGTPARAR